MGSITDVPGIRVGHAQDLRAQTGCTVVLCEEGAVAGVDIRGSAPGTRETVLLQPGFLIQRVHAVLLTGGSAFGLDAAGGVQQYLEEKGVGYDARGVLVPIVPAAVIFDLHVGDSRTRPDKAMGYRACQNATDNNPQMGRVGVGAGATVGKILGMSQAMKGGVGTCSQRLEDVVVGALVVVNALGDVVDPFTGQILAGAQNPKGPGFLNTSQFIRQQAFAPPLSTQNTTLAVVATNAQLTKEQANFVAKMAQDGIARAVRPAHTLYDGDIVFVLSTGDRRCHPTVIGDVAAELVAQAIVLAVKAANPAQKG